MTVFVTVKIRSKKPGLTETAPGYFEVRVGAVPEGGRANTELIAMLAKHFRVAKSRVIIAAGATRTKKIVEIV